MDIIEGYRGTAAIEGYDSNETLVLDIIANTDAPLTVAVAAAVLCNTLNWSYDHPNDPFNTRAVKVVDPNNEHHFVIITA